MGFIKFNKVPRHKRFDFIPRYYDPKKEELEEIVDAYKNKGDTAGSKHRIRSGLRSRYNADAKYKSAVKRSANFRLASIIFVLFLMAYLLLQSDTIMRMVEAFTE